MVREGKQMRRAHSQKWQERLCHMFRKQVMALNSTSYTAGGTQRELTQPLEEKRLQKSLTYNSDSSTCAFCWSMQQPLWSWWDMRKSYLLHYKMFLLKMD